MGFAYKLYDESVNLLGQKYGFGPLGRDMVIPDSMDPKRFIDQQRMDQIWIENKRIIEKTRVHSQSQ